MRSPSPSSYSALSAPGDSNFRGRIPHGPHARAPTHRRGRRRPRRKARYRLGGLTLGRAGIAPAGRSTEFHGLSHRSLPSDQPSLVAPKPLHLKNKWARIEALQRLKDWLAAYRDCWLQFASGVRDVVFPAGTYALRRNLGVCCAPAPDTG